MRIVTSAAAGRPDYFDRNPAAHQLGYNPGGVAPHANTVRASYTVPAGKKAWIDAALLTSVRFTAAAPVGLSETDIYRVVSGAGAYFLKGRLMTNGVGDKTEMNVGAAGFLSSADSLSIATNDGSTGGSIIYGAWVTYTEFDA